MQNILIVDDSRSVLVALKSQIEVEKFKVFTAQSVAQAWELLENQNIDCVLTDFEMPEVNGPEFCKRIKASQQFGHIPIIMLTSLGHLENLLIAINSGADDFISKDSDMRIILAKIGAMLRLKGVQEELVKLRRVEGIKQVVATYNHVFNNPLTVALGNLNWLKKTVLTSIKKNSIILGLWSFNVRIL